MVGGGRDRDQLVSKAHQSIERGSRSFAVAANLFDKPTRERAWMLYAWCRRCDDDTDGQDHGGTPTAPERDARDRVKAIRILTMRSLEGQPTADIGFDAFGQVAMEAGLTADMAEDLIEGFALDAEGWRPRTEADLMRYCYHVAGGVGVMMAKVMNVPPEDEAMFDRACDLGLAFQLVNISRDVAEDAAAGRCYLPVEWLVEADIPPGQHMRPEYRKELVALVARVLDMAERHEAAARIGAAQLPFRQRWAVLAAANIYGAIGRKVRRRGAKAWDKRVRVSAFGKFLHLIEALLDAMKTPPEPEEWPRWTRGELLVMVRMAGPIAGIPQTPLPDEEEQSL
ncbi:phytoene/squalene synthase family protein [Altericroceibacterium xinjiangense]|uniref:phytoene/squalene synthase family protein n=1 Tax=Altericroceibacterium xinjiangense TaxID=762261 RepID=UPI001F4A0A02|nr:phytoene/squalene synthase family protein [Altericroceibacterium xinjiangense]